MTVAVPYEQLEPGPVGRRVAVIDYDATNDCYYRPVDLDDPTCCSAAASSPSESRSALPPADGLRGGEQTIEQFEAALGRADPLAPRRAAEPPAARRPAAHLSPRHGRGQRLLRPRQRALLFGYFRATDEPGRNLPGQIVYTCLSHDIIVHETTHAIVDGIRPLLHGADQTRRPAFHEAFADIVALFQHFTLREVLLDTIHRTGGCSTRPSSLADAGPTAGGARPSRPRSAEQPAGRAGPPVRRGLGNRAALRSALGTPPDPADLERATEPHERGAILVAAVFDAFFTVYLRRTADLLRIARAGGTRTHGRHQPGPRRPAGRRGHRTAARILHMCVRALDYCPPVDITFGDFLRALITADFDLVPDDPLASARHSLTRSGGGASIRTACSMSEEALRWSQPTGAAVLECPGLDPDPRTPPDHRANAIRLATFARANAEALGLDPSLPINVDRYEAETSQQLDRYGGLRAEFNVQIVQRRTAPVDGDDGDGASFVFRGGSTIILDGDGKLIYLIGKGVANADREEIQRRYLQAAAASCRDTAVDAGDLAGTDALRRRENRPGKGVPGGHANITAETADRRAIALRGGRIPARRRKTSR